MTITARDLSIRIARLALVPLGMLTAVTLLEGPEAMTILLMVGPMLAALAFLATRIDRPKLLGGVGMFAGCAPAIGILLLILLDGPGQFDLEVFRVIAFTAISPLHGVMVGALLCAALGASTSERPGHVVRFTAGCLLLHALLLGVALIVDPTDTLEHLDIGRATTSRTLAFAGWVMTSGAACLMAFRLPGVPADGRPEHARAALVLWGTSLLFDAAWPVAAFSSSFRGPAMAALIVIIGLGPVVLFAASWLRVYADPDAVADPDGRTAGIQVRAIAGMTAAALGVMTLGGLRAGPLALVAAAPTLGLALVALSPTLRCAKLARIGAWMPAALVGLGILVMPDLDRWLTPASVSSARALAWLASGPLEGMIVGGWLIVLLLGRVPHRATLMIGGGFLATHALLMARALGGDHASVDAVFLKPRLISELTTYTIAAIPAGIALSAFAGVAALLLAFDEEPRHYRKLASVGLVAWLLSVLAHTAWPMAIYDNWRADRREFAIVLVLYYSCTVAASAIGALAERELSPEDAPEEGSEDAPEDAPAE